MTEQEMFDLLCEERSLTEHIEELERTRRSVRATLANYVQEHGTFVTSDWQVRWQEPTISQGWDGNALTKFEEHLTTLHPELARALIACRTEKQRVGHIKVEPARKKAA